MLSIKPLGLGSAEEELASIGVGASIGHGENSRSSVLQGEVLILELVAVDGLATSSVVVGEVTTLNKKIFLTGFTRKIITNTNILTIIERVVLTDMPHFLADLIYLPDT